MTKQIITSFIFACAALALGGSIMMLNAVDAFMVDEMSMPAPVTLDIDGINFSATDSENTNSQYCSKDGSFTFFLATTFDNAFTLKMVIDSEEPFKLNHRYEIPLREAGKSSAGIYDYNFGKNDDCAVAGWIEFTSFEKEGGILTRDGDVRCSIAGKFGFTASGTDNPEKTIEITEGSFRIPEARYSDRRTIK